MTTDQETAARASDALVTHYDRCLTLHGDTARGADWPDQADRERRFDVMLDVIDASRDGPITLCDLGCGSGDLLRHLQLSRGLTNLSYIGADRSDRALSFARRKFPGARFVGIDVVTASEAELDALACDYLVANGLFTVKGSLSDAEMAVFLATVIERVWPRVRRGLAFNVMSTNVDWRRDDLFHLPMDDAARLLHRLAGRRVRLRADYGLYEYTAYAHKPASASVAPVPSDPASPAMEARLPPVPVCRPSLPPVDALQPYLRQIDDRRVYSNNGPLALSLEERLRDHFGMASGRVVAAGSGTAALIGAVLACAGRATPERPLAFIPGFTFVATAVALELCGYEVHLLDIDPDTWMLDADAVADHPLLGRAGVVIPVAPLGRPVPITPWQAFKARTGVPVIIDAAASFNEIGQAPERFIGDIPVVLSFHATKAFCTAEGGAVLTRDFMQSIAITQALNFGFHGSRDSRVASLNGKMSEYHAAVGHADLDRWPQKVTAFRRVAEGYRERFAALGLPDDRLLLSPGIGCNYAVLNGASDAESAAAQTALEHHGIEFRRWYGDGIQGHGHFRDCSADRLHNGEAAAKRLIGLPMSVDLDEASLDRIAAALQGAIR